MNEKILIVTPPSDIIEDHISILTVGLNNEQTVFVSECLKSVEQDDLTVYLWQENDSRDWLFDKIKKSDLIVLNAEMNDQTLVGYIVANKKTLYLGNLLSIDFLHQKILNNKQTFLQVIDQLKGIYG